MAVKKRLKEPGKPEEKTSKREVPGKSILKVPKKHRKKSTEKPKITSDAQ
jgi:hypothetical protein